MSAPKMTQVQMAALVEEAEAAGMEAATGTRPTPMLVGQPKDMMDSLMGGDGGGLDESKPIYRVNDGVCGFAWINVKPGTSRFARWLKETGRGRSDSYYGGVTIWVNEFRQSMTLKQAYAQAYAQVLRDAGINAQSMSRMD